MEREREREWWEKKCVCGEVVARENKERECAHSAAVAGWVGEGKRWSCAFIIRVWSGLLNGTQAF